MNFENQEEVRKAVRKNYGSVARGGRGCCGAEEGESCRPEAAPAQTKGVSERMGYSPEEVGSVPAGADMGLGCGNPQAIAGLQPGEAVLDLGSGGGIDCFLAAKRVGERGRGLGVDMTPEMVEKARANAARGGYGNVEFRLGEIERLPVSDASVDVVISNCVVNLSPDKPAVFREAYRVLKPGGRLAISDVVASAELPEEARRDLAAWSGCMSGAATVEQLTGILRAEGFVDVGIEPKDESREFIKDWSPGRSIADYIVSAAIKARKPPAVTQ